MGDMSEESSNLALRVVGGGTAAELRERVDGFEEGVSGVEAPAGTVSGGPVGNAAEELRRHDVRHRRSSVVVGRRTETRPALAPVAAVVVACAAVAESAAAQVRATPAVLSRRTG